MYLFFNEISTKCKLIHSLRIRFCFFPATFAYLHHMCLLMMLLYDETNWATEGFFAQLTYLYSDGGGSGTWDLSPRLEPLSSPTPAFAVAPSKIGVMGPDLLP